MRTTTLFAKHTVSRNLFFLYFFALPVKSPRDFPRRGSILIKYRLTFTLFVKVSLFHWIFNLAGSINSFPCEPCQHPRTQGGELLLSPLSPYRSDSSDGTIERDITDVSVLCSTCPQEFSRSRKPNKTAKTKHSPRRFPLCAPFLCFIFVCQSVTTRCYLRSSWVASDFSCARRASCACLTTCIICTIGSW